MSKLKRTHTCGQLRIKDVKSTVTLLGWVSSIRDHGGLIFIDLRDRYGITQVVFNPDKGNEFYTTAGQLRPEYVVAIQGAVSARPEGTLNPNLDTGEIEVYADTLEILNKSETPPFEIEDESKVSLELRLKHRYLDLRRPVMQRRLIFRHKVCQVIREYLDRLNFIDIETPVLTKSTPEGARDYLVPSRVNLGKFYALPQSPQLFKQILMVAGYDRYFQIVRCFRDEDLRAQRQPEFTQMDMEMSFVDENDIIQIIEGLVAAIFDKVIGKKVATPFPRLSYNEAMASYGCDAPDLRFGMKIKDISDIVQKSDFKVFLDTVKSGGQVRGVNANGCGNFSRKDIDDLTAFVGQFGAKGLAWFKVEEKGLSSSITKFFPEETREKIRQYMDAKKGDLLLFVADKPKVVSQSLAQLRLHLAQKNKLIDTNTFYFSWVVDFPLFDYNEDLQRYEALHHPFTSPHPDDLPILEEKPLEVKARAYDLVLNGVELGGGSIRIHAPEVQKRVFRLLGIEDESAYAKFGFLLDALKYGAPPHGGIALGVDRMVTLLLQLDDIREVIAFPKTQKATCLMTNAPSEVDLQQLKELGIRLL
ncbi:MAG: aspartate--tRNA ligase [Candidatus Brocadia sp. AMX2]|uniref:Aspartate--tRNA(Asp/Asn) ligase n=1 Tax=Candidatus Brocadia sinica JPN1 TaxID=1197129 RepID=A0ABQ0JT16_9BACT|nr:MULTISPECIES: aspartate--tRNA ligase [Brocadia]KXK30568.1 MAG: aspartyl-tRNA synthase [Candidatus Brocadia sinica]MBC6931618.1 aspartate--tRNA ligase [Candidatus Brocadia sp.]MBL1169017.1 aspartate--tRNA ligase [Candidatus Brocadia sp. AMX1]NOG43449.1 aspartate--tRNA ligase [Planctomycetota bacterium]KAA0245217.1 MAG: aspartate--tRNA ligase [Candidatus Brocadia sp. AMX2]